MRGGELDYIWVSFIQRAYFDQLGAFTHGMCRLSTWCMKSKVESCCRNLMLGDRDQWVNGLQLFSVWNVISHKLASETQYIVCCLAWLTQHTQMYYDKQGQI